MKKIIVRINGGLGNQLHCYAFGRAIAANNGASLVLDTDSGYWKDPYHRKYLLDSFPFLRAIKKPPLKTRLQRLIYKAKIKIGLAFGSVLPLTIRPVVREPDPLRYQNAIHFSRYLSTPIFLGYWASYRYYVNLESQLRYELTPPTPDDKSALQALNEISSVKSCFVHWRSYGEVAGARRPSHAAYYRRAFELMREKHPDIYFFIFSDDIQAAQEELQPLIDKAAKFVDIKSAKGNTQSLIDFYLMYSCKHAIIGDSTFSWWAAWLSDREAKVVVAPQGLSPWGHDWIPENWIGVSVHD